MSDQLKPQDMHATDEPPATQDLHATDEGAVKKQDLHATDEPLETKDTARHVGALSSRRSKTIATRGSAAAARRGSRRGRGVSVGRCRHVTAERPARPARTAFPCRPRRT